MKSRQSMSEATACPVRLRTQARNTTDERVGLLRGVAVVSLLSMLACGDKGTGNDTAADTGDTAADTGDTAADTADDTGESSEPPYVDVAVSKTVACGLLQDGTAECWGAASMEDALNSGAPLQRILGFEGMGDYGAGLCGVTVAGEIVCTESGYAEYFTDGPYTDVSIAIGEMCALREDGTPDCPFDRFWDEEDWPAVPMTDLTAGYGVVCGLGEDLSVYCATKYYGEPLLKTIPGGKFTQIDLGHHHGCGIQTDGSLSCWGIESDYFDWYETPPPEGRFLQVVAGDDHSCALDEDGRAHCWGRSSHPLNETPEVRFTVIAMQDDLACGLREDGRIQCWGSEEALY